MNVNWTIPSNRMAVIDAHTHIFPDAIAEKAKQNVGEFYHMPMYTAGTLSELYRARLTCHKPYQIVAQVIFSPAITATQTKSINDFIAGLCLADASLIGFGTLHKENKDYAEEIRRIRSLGLKGIKFHSDFQKTDIDDEAMFPIYQEIARQQLPVIFHMGDKHFQYSSVSKLKHVLDEIPELVVIAAHMGGFAHWQEVYDTLPVCEHLFFDTSNTLRFLPAYECKALLDKFGVHKFFFGSDFPMWNPMDELDLLHTIQLNEEDYRKIEYDNFVTFLKKYC